MVFTLFTLYIKQVVLGSYKALVCIKKIGSNDTKQLVLLLR